MKTMTCIQLGGACDQEFHGSTFEEMAELSKKHAMEMIQKEDKPHLEAMNKMNDLMQTADAIQKWFEAKRKEFNQLAEN